VGVTADPESEAFAAQIREILLRRQGEPLNH